MQNAIDRLEIRVLAIQMLVYYVASYVQGIALLARASPITSHEDMMHYRTQYLYDNIHAHAYE